MRIFPDEFYALLRSTLRPKTIRALSGFALLLLAVVLVFTLLFHALMAYEGRGGEHSLFTGFYWTLTVMSTLGFGDVTFGSDLGRAFSMLVLLSGLAVLLIAVPTIFTEYVLKPWLDDRDRLFAPRTLEEGIRDHVVICHYDEIAEELIPRLLTFGIECVVLEAHSGRTLRLREEGVRAVYGEPTKLETFRSVRTHTARAVLANLDDAENTSVTLTVREIAPNTPVIAIAEEPDAVDILQLAGAAEVVPLKRRLAEQLACRVGEDMEVAHRLGRVDDLFIAEFPIRATDLKRDTLGAAKRALQGHTGVQVIGVWERGELRAAADDTELDKNSVLLLAGTNEQLTDLNATYVIYHAQDAPVLVIGGGAVGHDVCDELRKRGVPVTVLERDPARREVLGKVAARVVVGDGANRDAIVEAGVLDAPSVVLTTNDDAMNIFLAVYCRKLRPEAHIVSRITHSERREPMRRAGSDFALSHGALAVQMLISFICKRELVVIGDTSELFIEPVPARFCGGTLAESGIARATGLQVIGLRAQGGWRPNPPPDAVLAPDSALVMIGNAEQRRSFLALGGDG